MPNNMSVDQVKAEVQRFWTVFSTKDAQALRRFYSSGATVFSSSSSRYELGPVSAARRHREYFQRSNAVWVRLGDVHVEMLGEHSEGAVASYTFQFHATNVITASGVIEEDIQLGRATHVFALNALGQLCIVHEHLSLPTWPQAGLPIPPAYMPDYTRSPA
jgi:ketosteroid isomerase-like protein